MAIILVLLLSGSTVEVSMPSMQECQLNVELAQTKGIEAYCMVGTPD